MNADIRQLEINDFDLMNNIKASFIYLWRMKAVVVLITVIGFLASLLYVGIVGIDTNYYASASLYSAVYGSFEDSNYGVTVMNKYASLLSTSRVCERAAALLDDTPITATELRSLALSNKIYIAGTSTDSKSYGIRVSVVAMLDSPEYVVQITNAMATAFAGELNDFMGSDSIQVFDEATSYSSSKSVNFLLVFLLCGMIAFVFSAIIIFAVAFFSPKVMIVEQCEDDEDYILGMVPQR